MDCEGLASVNKPAAMEKVSIPLAFPGKRNNNTPPASTNGNQA
jgi:hypothetical protein